MSVQMSECILDHEVRSGAAERWVVTASQSNCLQSSVSARRFSVQNLSSAIVILALYKYSASTLMVALQLAVILHLCTAER